MKNTIVIFSIVLLAACQSPGKPGKENPAANPVTDISGDSTGGARLISVNDCAGCHSLTAKNSGPSFLAIAERYPDSHGTAENLAYSIVDGMKGAWGKGSAMPAHKNVSYKDAVKMAEYILSVETRLKNDSAEGKIDSIPRGH
ncbi:MAG TPA: c-type cytochrome [Chitinophagaceae bacterium]|jgi:cytochrome c|nr:c-type cytochrome [Chitinophagaceae bacterium]